MFEGSVKLVDVAKMCKLWLWVIKIAEVVDVEVPRLGLSLRSQLCSSLTRAQPLQIQGKHCRMLSLCPFQGTLIRTGERG